jgi:hypothetical protein
MIATELAQQLKRAGLEWTPAEHDHFMIPDRQMDNQIFVVSQFTALVQMLKGQPAVTFHGSSEWALDYIMLADIVWLPTETQLREALAARIGVDAPLRLERTLTGYRCQIACGARQLDFDAATAEDAYALALLYVLRANRK